MALTRVERLALTAFWAQEQEQELVWWEGWASMSRALRAAFSSWEVVDSFSDILAVVVLVWWVGLVCGVVLGKAGGSS